MRPEKMMRRSNVVGHSQKRHARVMQILGVCGLMAAMRA
jgi:hypothetical protein